MFSSLPPVAGPHFSDGPKNSWRYVVFRVIACIGRISMLDVMAHVRRVNRGEVPLPSPEKVYSDESLKLSVGTCIVVMFSRVDGTTASADGVIKAASGRNLAQSVK